MKKNVSFYNTPSNVRTKIVLAGLAGGIAEIVWISLYSHLYPISAINIARQISATVLPFTMDAYYAPIFGVVIHLVLSLLLAYFFVSMVFKSIITKYGTTGIILSSMITLTIIWKVNFFIVLPIINPSFTTLMPLTTTLISKLLFGLTMGWVLVKDFSHENFSNK